MDYFISNSFFNDVREAKITRDEFIVLVLLITDTRPYSNIVHCTLRHYSDLIRLSKPVVSKILKSLRTKGYIFFKDHRGPYAVFPVSINKKYMYVE